ncbi:hypothetical protein ELH27_36720 [Rhizobium leguminosarum]|uniref:Uncharacterized protein n=1 Tax=Rhizobium beringeri TaxID=3019934 RepID=A0ABY1XLD2_9HYPH|nr:MULTISPECIES: hypothetical protein [Rhizobium]TAU35281.1 hypothetical protein ELI43_37075 [Rhizobium leguminosarum]TBC53817.1 hypothetical protein ELH27_36720 [Rhizobium leguminosarum]TBE60623.1 hypothetical protein ELH03_27510 [Rhizobium beringeri]
MLPHWSIVALAFFYASYPGSAVSQSASVSEELDCVKPSNEQYNEFHHGLNPERKFRIDVGPYRFAVPWKYLQPRPANFQEGCKIRADSLGVQFWIPDGKAPERDLFFNGEYNPPEPRRPHPTENEWVIKFVDISHYSVGPSARADPDLQFKNIMRLFEKEASIKQDGDLKLIEFDDPSKTSKYWFQEDDEKSLFFWCGRSAVCQGVIDLKDKHLAGQFLLTRPSIRFHATIVSTLQNLLQQWELANK